MAGVSYFVYSSLITIGLICTQSKGDQFMGTTNVNKQNSVKNMEAQGKKAAEDAAYSPTMERLARLGYGVKGLIYITMGLLAIQGALGKAKTPADQLGGI